MTTLPATKCIWIFEWTWILGCPTL